jgi:hypothetical protein
MLYLGWLGTCLQYVWLIQSRHKPLWSFSFLLLMPFYASLNDVLSLCMIMAVIVLLVGRSQSFASPHCTEYELYSCIQLLKIKLFQCVYHTYLLAICYSKVHLTFFYLSFKLNSFGVIRKLVSKVLTNLMTHFTFLAFKNLTLWLSYVELLCLWIISWKLAKPCRHGVSFQYCTSLIWVDIVIFCLWILAIWNKLGILRDHGVCIHVRETPGPLI